MGTRSERILGIVVAGLFVTALLGAAAVGAGAVGVGAPELADADDGQTVIDGTGSGDGGTDTTDTEGDDTDSDDTDSDDTDSDDADDGQNGDADGERGDATETLVVRFEPHGEGIGAQDAADGEGPSVEELRRHADETKAEFRDRYADDDVGAQTADAAAVTIKREFWLANAALVEVDTDRVPESKLLETPGVERVHENFAVEVDSTAASGAGSESMTSASMSTDSDEFTYGLNMINVPAAWERFDEETEPGEGATVAVLDTGVDTDHEDLSVSGWAEFNSFGIQTAESFDDEADEDAFDDNGHGTHVAGTVGGSSDPAGSEEKYGVAPGASLYGVKVLDENGGGSFGQVVGGMEWAIERDEVDVLQLSLGSEGTEDDFIEPVRNARNNNKIVVASVGNDDAGSSSSPGNVFESFPVGAVDSDEAVADFSGNQTLDRDADWDEAPDDWPETYDVPVVVAPGVFVESAAAGTGDGTTPLSGTSMAAPHAAGTVALIVSATDGAARESTIRNAITDTAVEPDGDDQQSRYGSGLIDADAAIGEALASLDDPVVSGTVTDTDDVPIEGATVSSDAEGTPSTETNENGEYELTVPPAEQELSVTAFGFLEETRTVDPELDDRREENFDLNPTVAARIADEAPSRFEAGDDAAYTVVFDVANVEEYEISFNGDTRTFDDDSSVDTEDVDVAVSEDGGESKSIDLDTPDDVDSDTETLTVEITPANDLELSKLGFDHTVTGSVPDDETTETLETNPTTIQPDTVEVRERNLRDLARFVDDGSTLEVDGDATVSVDDTEPSGVDLDRAVTLTGPDQTITVDDPDDDATDPVGVLITADGVDVDGPTIVDDDAGLSAGIAVRDVGFGTTDGIGAAENGGVVAIDDVETEDSTTGVRVENAAGVSGTGIEVSASDVGVSIVGSENVDLSDVTIAETSTGTGVELDDSAENVDVEATIADGATLDAAVAFGSADEVGTNAVAVTFEGADREEAIVVDGRHATVAEDEEPTDGNGNGDSIRPENEDDEELTPLNVFLELDEVDGEADQQVDLTVPYTTDEARQFDEETLALYRFDDDAEEWDRDDLETTHDADAPELSVTVDSFSTFGIYGEEQAFYAVSDFSVDSPTDGEIERGETLEASAEIENVGGADADNERTAELRLGSDVSEGGDYEVLDSEELATLDMDETVTVDLSGAVPDSTSLGENQEVAIVAVGPDGDEGSDDEPLDVVDRSLSGTVTAEDTDDPIENATVSITDGDEFDAGRSTDENGEYRIEGLDDGSYDVTVDADGFGSNSSTVTADRFDETVRDVELDPNPGSIQGTVTDADTDDPIEGATVSVGGDSADTDADGEYLLDEVARGDRSVTVTADGYDESTRTVTVEADETATADFGLDPIPIFTVEAIDVPDSVRQGDTLSVDATIRNDGAGAGDTQVELDALGGTTEEDVDLDPGAETTVTLSRSVSTGTDTGTYDATVSTPDDSRTAQFEVRERLTGGGGGGGGGSSGGGGGGGGGPTGPLPEDVRLKGFPSPSVPAAATTGEEVTISFGLRNRGRTVTDPVRVLANGAEIGRHDRFITPGNEVDIEVRHTFLEPGSYAIRIDVPGLDESGAVIGTIEVTGDPITPEPDPAEDAPDAGDTDEQPPEDDPGADGTPTEPTPPDGVDDEAPGFGLVAAIVGIVLAARVLAGPGGRE